MLSKNKWYFIPKEFLCSCSIYNLYLLAFIPLILSVYVFIVVEKKPTRKVRWRCRWFQTNQGKEGNNTKNENFQENLASFFYKWDGLRVEFFKFSFIYLQQHAFFRHIDWNDLHQHKVEPPFKPCVVSWFNKIFCTLKNKHA